LCDGSTPLTPGERQLLREASDEFDARYALWLLLDQPLTADLSAGLRESLGLPLDRPLTWLDFNQNRPTAYFAQPPAANNRPADNQEVMLLLCNLFDRCLVCGEPATGRAGSLWCDDHAAWKHERRLRKQLSRARRNHAGLAALVAAEFRQPE
jgi:hypothetical protein